MGDFLTDVEATKRVRNSFVLPRVPTSKRDRIEDGVVDAFTKNITGSITSGVGLALTSYDPEDSGLRGMKYTPEVEKQLLKKGIYLPAYGIDPNKTDSLAQLAYVLDRKQAENTRNAVMQGSENTTADKMLAFASSFVGSLADPVNIPFMFIGPPGYAAATSAVAGVRTVGQMFAATTAQRLTSAAVMNSAINDMLEQSLILPVQSKLQANYTQEDAAVSTLIAFPVTGVLGGIGEYLSRGTRRSIYINSMEAALFDNNVAQVKDILRLDRKYMAKIRDDDMLDRAIKVADGSPEMLEYAINRIHEQNKANRRKPKKPSDPLKDRTRYGSLKLRPEDRGKLPTKSEVEASRAARASNIYKDDGFGTLTLRQEDTGKVPTKAEIEARKVPGYKDDGYGTIEYKPKPGEDPRVPMKNEVPEKSVYKDDGYGTITYQPKQGESTQVPLKKDLPEPFESPGHSILKYDPVKGYNGNEDGSFSVEVQKIQNAIDRQRLEPTFKLLSKLADDFEARDNLPDISGMFEGTPGSKARSIKILGKLADDIDSRAPDPDSSHIHRAVTAMFDRTFGVKIRFIPPENLSLVGTAGTRIRGALFGQNADTIFLALDPKANSPRDYFQVAGHELGHSIRSRMPHVWGDIIKVIESSKLSSKLFAGKVRDLIDKQGRNIFLGNKPLSRVDEVYADIFGDLVQMNEFWVGLKKVDKAKSHTLGDYILNVFESLYLRSRQADRIKFDPVTREVGEIAKEAGTKARRAMANAGVTAFSPGYLDWQEGTREEVLSKQKAMIGYEKRARWMDPAYDPDNYQANITRLMGETPEQAAHRDSILEGIEDDLPINFLGLYFKWGSEKSKLVPKFEDDGVTPRKATFNFNKWRIGGARAWKARFGKFSDNIGLAGANNDRPGFSGSLPPNAIDIRKNLRTNYVARQLKNNEDRINDNKDPLTAKRVAADAAVEAKKDWDTAREQFIEATLRNSVVKRIFEGFRSEEREGNRGMKFDGYPTVVDAKTHKPLAWTPQNIIKVIDGTNEVHYYKVDNQSVTVKGTGRAEDEGALTNTDIGRELVPLDEGIDKLKGVRKEGFAFPKAMVSEIDEFKKAMFADKQLLKTFIEDLQDYMIMVTRFNLTRTKGIHAMFPTWKRFENMFGTYSRVFNLSPRQKKFKGTRGYSKYNYTPIEHLLSFFRSRQLTPDDILVFKSRKLNAVDHLKKVQRGVSDSGVTDSLLDIPGTIANMEKLVGDNILDGAFYRMITQQRGGKGLFEDLLEEGLTAGYYKEASVEKQRAITEKFQKFMTGKYKGANALEIMNTLYTGIENKAIIPDNFARGNRPLSLSDDAWARPPQLFGPELKYAELMDDAYLGRIETQQVLSLEEVGIRNEIEGHKAQGTESDDVFYSHDVLYSREKEDSPYDDTPDYIERIKATLTKTLNKVEQKSDELLDRDKAVATKQGQRHIEQIKKEVEHLKSTDKEFLEHSLRLDFGDNEVSGKVIDYILSGKQLLADFLSTIDPKEQEGINDALFGYAKYRSNLLTAFKRSLRAIREESPEFIASSLENLPELTRNSILRSLDNIIRRNVNGDTIDWTGSYKQANVFLRTQLDESVRSFVLTERLSKSTTDTWTKRAAHSVELLLSKLDGKIRNAKFFKGSGINTASRMAGEVVDTLAPFTTVLNKHGMAEAFKRHPRLANMVVEYLEGSLDPKNIDEILVDAIVEIGDTYRALNDRWLYRMRRTGSAIQPLERFSLSVIHDPTLIRAAGKESWTDAITKLIDWDAMKERYGELPNKKAYLSTVYDSILSERKRDLNDWAEDLAGTSVASPHAKHRALILKPGAIIKYDKNFGSGSKNLSGRLINQLQKRAELVALIQEFGHDLSKAKSNIMSALLKSDAPSSKRLGNFVDPQGRERFNHIFDHITGILDNPVDTKIANTGKVLRMYADLVFGGTFGIAGLTDVAFMSHQLRYMGLSLGEAEKALSIALKDSFNRKFRGKDPETRSALQSSGAGIEALTNALARRLGVEQGGSFGRLGTLHNIMFNLNGVNTWTEIAQEAIVDVTQTHLARFLKGELGKQATLEVSHYLSKFDITPDDIHYMKHKMKTQSDTSRVTELNYVDHAELQRKMRALNHETMRTGVLYPNISDEAYLRLRTRSGTLLGESVRTITKYMPFIMSIHSRIYDRFANGFGKQGFFSRQGFVANRSRIETMIFVAQGLFMGWMVLNLKEMAKGREPLHFMQADQWNSDNARRILERSGMDGVLGFLFKDFDFGPVIGPMLDVKDNALELDATGAVKSSLNFVPGKTLPGVEPVIKSLFALIFYDIYAEALKREAVFFESRYGQSSLYNFPETL